jgi:hypothetical protein
VSSNNTVRLIDFSNNQQQKEEFENELAVNLTYLAILQQTEQTLIVVIPLTTYCCSYFDENTFFSIWEAC